MLTESLPKAAMTRIQWNSETIYKYNRKIEHILKRLESSKHYDLAESFVVALKLSGLSLGRVYYYSNRLGKIIRWFEQNDVDPRNVTTDELKRCLANLLEPRYSGETKRATAHTLKRFVNYAKTGNIGKKTIDSDYCSEVRFIVPSSYSKGSSVIIKKSDLLTSSELISFFKAVAKVSRYPMRDVPMVMCFYECAFRPGELLQMRVGGIVYKEYHAEINTTGKTGEKTAPVVLAYKPLLEWLQHHPHKDDIEAPLWWSFSSVGPLQYEYLRQLVKKAAREAGIRKKIWNYLLRHTKLTDFAKKHSNQLLKKLGNWKRGTKMMDVYVHLSNEDLEDAVLEEHGLKNRKQENKLTTKLCPRCNVQCTDVDARCGKCGLILYQELAMRVVKKEEEYKSKMQETIKNLERQMNQLMQMYQNVPRKNNIIVKDELQHH